MRALKIPDNSKILRYGVLEEPGWMICYTTLHLKNAAAVGAIAAPRACMHDAWLVSCSSSILNQASKSAPYFANAVPFKDSKKHRQY
eukprot:5655251-Amphidinium_carterae.1